MQLQMWHVEQALILQLAGRLDVTTCEQLKHIWKQTRDEKFFIVDLSSLEFLDSMGLATLVSGLKIARQRGGDLLLVNPASAIRIILDFTAMSRIFATFLTIDDATTFMASQL